MLDAFKRWLDEKHSITPPKGLLGQAINYTLSLWNRLIVYIEDGRLKLDNNVAENAIRPFVLSRKNFLFAGHPKGAMACATFLSLIETAKANGLETFSYLRHVFEKNYPWSRHRMNTAHFFLNTLIGTPLTACDCNEWLN